MGTTTKRRRRWLGLGVALIATPVVLLVGLPGLLLLAGKVEAGTVTHDGQPFCKVNVHAAWRAERLYTLAALSPLFRDSVRKGRRRLVGDVSDKYGGCWTSGSEVTMRFFSPGLALMDRIVRETARGPEQWADSRDLYEELLHGLDRDQDILDLARELPKGGDVQWRVTAALYLGEPKAAAAFWREPGARLYGYVQSLAVTRPGALCLAGDTKDGLASFDSRSWWTNPEDPKLLVANAHAECLLRAGRADDLAHFADTAKGVSTRWRQRWKIEAAIAKGDLETARAMSEKQRAAGWRLPGELRDMWLEVRTGHTDALAKLPFADWLRAHPSKYDSSLYRADEVPLLDTRRVRQVAEGLASTTDPALHRLAARAYLLLAVYLGRRWDPRFDATIAKAKVLDLASPDPENLRAAFAYFHGDWKTFDAAPHTPALAHLELARARLTGKAPLPPPEVPKAKDQHMAMGIMMLNPFDDSYPRIARLYRSGLDPEVQLSLLRRQYQVAPFPSQLYRLTIVVRQAELLHRGSGEPWRDRIAALRKMIDAQPDVFLLRTAATVRNMPGAW